MTISLAVGSEAYTLVQSDVEDKTKQLSQKPDKTGILDTIEEFDGGERLTRSIPHPVGMKASMQMNKSLIVIRGSARKVMRIATNVRNTRPFMILNRSWKFVLNLRLPTPKPCNDRYIEESNTMLRFGKKLKCECA